MRISDAFPSKYLKATDLGGREWSLTMSHVVMEDIGSDPKPVLYFAGAEKGLVLNKTNSEMIITMYGDETESWQGQPLTIKPDKTQFSGRIVDCIRVVWKARQNGGLPAQHPAAPAQSPPRPVGGMGAVAQQPVSDDPLAGDNIPF